MAIHVTKGVVRTLPERGPAPWVMTVGEQGRHACSPGTAEQDITAWLHAWEAGDGDAFEQLITAVYAELRRLADRAMVRERPGHTLQPTAVIHEAFVQLLGQHRVHWQSREHFFAVAATLMRRVLLRHAERKQAGKRGGGLPPLRLGPGLELSVERAETIVALDDALRALHRVDPRQGSIVELRFYGGLTVEETAGVLGIAPITVKREWRVAKAWLKHALAVETRRSA